ncbi:MAG: metallophosphoesterase, partial [Proteobacteria bacterium]|nr:metallophosphoesterase [Pseudomonadota bacterium]
MNTITWLHISDLHFKENDEWNRNIVLNALLKDVKKCVTGEGLRPDFITVTGDIAFKSAIEEYERAEPFFEKLLGATGVEKDRLLIVPGNHDVDLDAIPGMISRATRSLVDDRDGIIEVLSDSKERGSLFHKFHHYAGFITNYLENKSPFDHDHYYFVRTLTLAGRKVAILGLNSTWLYQKDFDRGCLALGEPQVRKALEESEGADLRIALMHHPFKWFMDTEGSCESLLVRSCDYILHGHLHQTGVTNLSTPDAGAMVLAAGAGFQGRRDRNACNWVRLDFDNNRGTVYLREYSDESGGFWTEDTRTYENAKGGRYDFPLGSKTTPKGGKKVPRGRTGVRAAKMDPALLESAYLRQVVQSCKSLPLGIIDPRAMEQTRQQTMDLAPLYVSLNTTSQAVDEGESP